MKQCAHYTSLAKYFLHNHLFWTLNKIECLRLKIKDRIYSCLDVNKPPYIRKWHYWSTSPAIYPTSHERLRSSAQQKSIIKILLAVILWKADHKMQIVKVTICAEVTKPDVVMKVNVWTPCNCWLWEVEWNNDNKDHEFMFNVVKGRQAQIIFLWFTWRSQLSTNTQTNANYLVQYNNDSHVSENSKKTQYYKCRKATFTGIDLW